jgi:two-component system, LytTR family, response regulator
MKNVIRIMTPPDANIIDFPIDPSLLALYKVPKEPEYVLVCTRRNTQIVRISDIIMIQSSSNYSNIYLSNGDRLFTSRTLKHWEEQIRNSTFFRCHASYLVNKKCILRYDKKYHILVLEHKLQALTSRRVRKELMVG